MIKTIKLLLLSLVVIPLIVDNSVFYPFVSGENVFLRSILVFVSLLFLIYFLFNQSFKDSIISKSKILIRNPLVISILSFYIIFLISTIFAIDKYSAFWGNLERAEGLVGLTYFLSFFIFSLFIFEKKDWLWFFRLSLCTSLVLLIKEFIQFSDGLVRPGSFLSNPTFLAGYLLFSIFSSVITLSEVKNIFWKYFSIIILFLSIIGIFMTETRGTMLGLVCSGVVILIYCILKGRDVFPGKFSLHKISSIILVLLIIFSVVFSVTRKNEIWKNIPGLSRVANMSAIDTTTETRVLNAKLSFQAVNPNDNSLKKLLIGWGPENFSLAYAKYFNPIQFTYENIWFDRAHNKFLDVLVMNGLLGFLSYLAIYLFFFKKILKNKAFSFLDIGFILFGVSLFVHLFFIFDQITTYISFFAVLAFFIYTNSLEGDIYKKNNNGKNILPASFFCILFVFLSFVFLRNDLPAYIQMKEYSLLRSSGNSKLILNNIDSVFTPMTVAQMDIRDDFISIVSDSRNIKNEDGSKLIDKAISRSVEYINAVPYNIKPLIYLANGYSNLGNSLRNITFLQKGEESFKSLLKITPNRPDANYGLALNLMYQQRYNESFVFFEKSFDLNPSFFNSRQAINSDIYKNFIKYFYSNNDKENLAKATNRLK